MCHAVARALQQLRRDCKLWKLQSLRSVEGLASLSEMGLANVKT